MVDRCRERRHRSLRSACGFFPTRPLPSWSTWPAMLRTAASTSCGWATRGRHAIPSPCSPRRRSSPTGSGWPPASRTRTCVMPVWRPRACSPSTSSAAAEPCSGSVRGDRCRCRRSAWRLTSPSAVCVSSSMSPGPLRPGHRQPVTRLRTSPSTRQAVGAPLPVFVGARGPRLNRLASELADGAFVSGMPPFRYPAVVDWARSERPIDIALYPSVAFTEEAVERHRPEMIWSLLDTPAGSAGGTRARRQRREVGRRGAPGRRPGTGANADRRHRVRTGDAGGPAPGGRSATGGTGPRAPAHEHRARPAPGRPARRRRSRGRGLRRHDRRT